MALPSDELKRVALAQGFDSVGVCDAGPPEHLDAYIEWIESGSHAGMGYMATYREQRTDPASLLPGVKSILAVSLNYYREVKREQGQPKVARYALGRDYHKVLRGKLKRIAGWTEETYGVRARPCVDSAPVLERDFAQKAGIGWFGKNTMLIDSRRGSWFFIGLLLLDARFEPEEPARGGCGTCRACIDACPTGALVLRDDRPIAVLDSQKCISYRTIEHRGDLPGDTHGWLFGCDICQEVCPFNAPRESAPLRATETTERDFVPRPLNLKPERESILSMSEDSFKEAYAGTSFMRAGVARMQRNAKALQPDADPNR